MSLALCEYLQSQSLVETGNHVSKLNTTLELTASCPGLDQINLTLCQYWSAKLNSFQFVQFSLLQQFLEIDQKWLRLPWYLRKSFELVNSVSVSEESTRRHRGDFSCISIISIDDEVVELSEENVIHTGEGVSTS